MMIRWVLFVLISISIVSAPVDVRAERGLAGVIDVEEHLGARIPRDIELRDESGKTIATSELFDDTHPVVLVLAYYRCPMLCPVVLQGVTKALRDAGLTMGTDYRLITVSIDPEDTPVEAQKRKDALLVKAGPEARRGAHFLVGSAAATRAVADAVGFRYAFDASTSQYAHPAVVMVLGPGGRISRYLYGPQPEARDVRLALTEAAEGKVGSFVDRVLLTCYRFDPATRRYGPSIVVFFRVGAIVIFVVVMSLLGMLWRLERRRRSERNST
ncbi:MAG TPA: SCO family protein [Polyangium sp.]|nr:SCO family protein [Polyangium sp.]